MVSTVETSLSYESKSTPLLWRKLGSEQPYESTVKAMRAFTLARVADTCDEVWWLEHSPVYTLGQAGRREHLIHPGDIPVVNSDRGGQVTFHGPGQLVCYFLVDLRRLGLGPKGFVHLLEQWIITLLDEARVRGDRRAGAPGVYVKNEKLCALGLRVRSGCAYHGLALNVNMDLEPFRRIDPCGYVGLKVTDLKSLGVDWTLARTASLLRGVVSGGEAAQ